MQIILLGDRGMCVNNLSRVALDSRPAGIRTRKLLTARPAAYRYASKSHHLANKIFCISNPKGFCEILRGPNLE